MNGTLYIVATPIGNLGDMGSRAVEVLKQADLIAAEDTRHSKPLLQHFAINTPMCAYHEHNESEQTSVLIDKIQAGDSIALISDAGTPLINDPGYRLVAAAHECGITVIPVPGPSAVIAALSVAGLPTNRFAFEGYLPAKSGARKKLLEEIRNDARTIVLYETPHRIHAALIDMQTVLGGDRQVTLARELTKQYEQVVKGELQDILKQLEDNVIKARGEFVLVISGAAEVSADDGEALRIHGILAAKLSTKDAAALTAKITGRKKNEIYQLAVSDDNN